MLVKLLKTDTVLRSLLARKNCGQTWLARGRRGKEKVEGDGPWRKSAEPGVPITSFEQAAKNQVEIYHQDLEGGAGGKNSCRDKREMELASEATTLHR